MCEISVLSDYDLLQIAGSFNGKCHQKKNDCPIWVQIKKKGKNGCILIVVRFYTSIASLLNAHCNGSIVVTSAAGRLESKYI